MIFVHMLSRDQGVASAACPPALQHCPTPVCMCVRGRAVIPFKVCDARVRAVGSRVPPCPVTKWVLCKREKNLIHI